MPSRYLLLGTHHSSLRKGPAVPNSTALKCLIYGCPALPHLFNVHTACFAHCCSQNARQKKWFFCSPIGNSSACCSGWQHEKRTSIRFWNRFSYTFGTAWALAGSVPGRPAAMHLAMDAMKLTSSCASATSHLTSYHFTICNELWQISHIKGPLVGLTRQDSNVTYTGASGIFLHLPISCPLRPLLLSCLGNCLH